MDEFLNWCLSNSARVLVIVVIIDILLGISRAWAINQFSSYVARTGIVSHLFVAMLCIFGNKFAVIYHVPGVDYIIWLLVVSYMGSILENLSLLGVPIPNELVSKLTQVNALLNAQAEDKSVLNKLVSNHVDPKSDILTGTGKSDQINSQSESTSISASQSTVFSEGEQK